ncbi:poly-gamma-glutamate hydrolase family protein [Paludisphaera rhizosphaerae]|uniref:poly-gamma-glutamate hydrolase family protein n=1 Tax=Paludisphaera rhizosphaerae TaxID=2711216 RepID=UPI0013EB7B34|nr:poly-gamma-glutamate hydrolase family protein [Paludisphaera rhizosphaerae]
MNANHRRFWLLTVGACTCTCAVLSSRVPAQAPTPSFVAEVKKAEAGSELTKQQEHCEIDADRLAALGAKPGQQARIYKDSSTFAVYTLIPRQEEPDTIIRMGLSGRQRMGKDAPDSFSATVAIVPAPRSELTDEQADTQGELVERLDDDGTHTGLLIMAPHGGEIERPTDLQSIRLKEKLGKPRVSTWILKGYDPPGPQTAYGRWHITSTEISEASYPLLAQAGKRRYDYAFSFHGKAAEGLLVGGTGPMELKQEVAEALKKAVGDKGVEVVIAYQGQPLGGTTPSNIVNRYTDRGIQLEQGPTARREYWKEIADAVAEVYRTKL